jgi:NAD(P)-dependent dehydrogenase (short-subunit alcohol dehydrogenase family)
MDLQLTGRRVLVTGASRGIGLATVEAFLAEGAVVTATARKNTPGLEATGAEFVPADLSTVDGPRRLLDEVLDRNPRLDVLVNNAGGGSVTAEILADPLEGDDDTWATTFALNLDAAVRTVRAALPALLETRGAIVTISSDSARKPAAAPLPYASAKAALNAFSRGLAEKFGPQGLRVNVVTPSATRTSLMTGADSFTRHLADGMGIDQDTLLANIPGQTGMLTGRLIEPEEIARAVLVLSSPTMPSVIGANWAVDAGSTKVA